MNGEINERLILDSMPQPVLAVGLTHNISFANFAAQEFFSASLSSLRKHSLETLMPFGSPVVSLVENCLANRLSFNEYGLDLSAPHTRPDSIVDMHVAPFEGVGGEALALLVIQPRSLAHRIDKQLTHRGAARSVSAMSAMLAHEIKNPLSGIKGAAQLLESDVSAENTELTQLICSETERIAGLVDRFEQFSDTPVDLDMPINVHAILENVRVLAKNGFGSHVSFVEDYDPSLPDVRGNKDLLTQVFLNLVKNAAEAVDRRKGEIKLCSAFRPGIRLSVPGRARPIRLPLEFSVIDNGIGVSDDIKPHLFDPFVTTKSNGTGLGLALVAKIVGDHGGTIECDSTRDRTIFRVRLPMATPNVEPGEGSP
ncbi:MAG TPA: two-component sensor histidine kinase [Rhodobiaceae bacterium]|jgi:two-component system nitrogen regulation sensor histidine kinase GlnL|nr:two-component sensor histidine kinase [Rhodobiaceae bacterium]